MSVYNIRFWNYKKVMVVAKCLDDALATLTPEQRLDVRSTTCRRVILNIK